ncbi:hypothetical protein ACIBL3_18405 [Kribbella sp. NPDC050124]|uniref:hypothetical protein n=1 Tax=Kribbella sp. NPDC050124 TaxID=3364114 RepID=UPI0037B83230
MLEFAIFVIVMIVVSVVGKIKKDASGGAKNPNARVQKLIEQVQSQYGGQPTQVHGQYGANQYGANQSATPPPYQPQQQLSSQWLPSYGPPQGHRPPQHNLPSPRQDTDNRVRELMNAGNEVAAIRLLCDEQDMGILEAQEHARALVAPAQSSQSKPTVTPTPPPAPEEEETRYAGSAAFAESIFDLDRDEDTWASGWVDTPDPEDRTDIEELWQTVTNPPRPGTTPNG